MKEYFWPCARWLNWWGACCTRSVRHVNPSSHVKVEGAGWLHTVVSGDLKIETARDAGDRSSWGPPWLHSWTLGPWTHLISLLHIFCFPTSLEWCQLGQMSEVFLQRQREGFLGVLMLVGASDYRFARSLRFPSSSLTVAWVAAFWWIIWLWKSSFFSLWHKTNQSVQRGEKSSQAHQVIHVIVYIVFH